MKIAVVDDEEGNRKLMKSRMEALRPGAKIYLYINGDFFLDKYTEDGPFGIVFMDNHMPGKSGLEVVEEIRKRGYEGPVCMNSAIMEQADLAEMAAAQEEYEVDFIQKGPATTTGDYGRILEKYGI